MVQVHDIYQAVAGIHVLRNAIIPESVFPKYDRSKRLYISNIGIFYRNERGMDRWYDEVFVFEKKPTMAEFKETLQKAAEYYEKELRRIVSES